MLFPWSVCNKMYKMFRHFGRKYLHPQCFGYQFNPLAIYKLWYMWWRCISYDYITFCNHFNKMFSRNIDVNEAWSETILPKVIDMKLHRDTDHMGTRLWWWMWNILVQLVNTMAADALAMHVINRYQKLWYWIWIINRYCLPCFHGWQVELLLPS